MSRLENILKEKEYILSIDTPTYKVIGEDVERNSRNKKHKYYFIQCKKCGTIFSRRSSIIKENLNTVLCSNCRRTRYGKPLNTLEYKMYCFYRSSARLRGIEWDLSELEFKTLIKQNCHYCGSKPCRHQSVSYSDDYELVNGIDRVDSSKGYNINNCVSCCQICNIMKNTLSKKDFFRLIYKIYNHSIKSSTTIENTYNLGSELSTLQAKGSGSGRLFNFEDEDIVSTSTVMLRSS